MFVVLHNYTIKDSKIIGLIFRLLSWFDTFFNKSDKKFVGYGRSYKLVYVSRTATS